VLGLWEHWCRRLVSNLACCFLLAPFLPEVMVLPLNVKGVTHNIPHLRKNSLLDGLMELPFWHPGRYVHTTQFDAVFCGVILLNTFVMALEMQYMGLQRGYELGFPNFVQPASRSLKAEVVFGVIYLLELIIKLIGFKMRFFKEWWNWFDGILVVMWLAEFTLRDVIQMDGAILRMMRMARLLRLIRLVKTIQGFDALYIMTTALMGSTVCLFWSFMLLMTVQIMIAFFLNESLETYFQDKTKPVSEKLQVFEYFGTTARVMLTMFELTLANWPVAARILQENVTEYYSIFSVAYKLIIGFAAVGIINGVFMQETFKVAASDDKLMMRQKERDRWLHTKKMRVLFQAADESGDGYLDREEFLEIMNIPEVRPGRVPTMPAFFNWDSHGMGKPECCCNMMSSIPHTYKCARRPSSTHAIQVAASSL
ncbi:unnamed protein product, partial [Effrenium voratum]